MGKLSIKAVVVMGLVVAGVTGASRLVLASPAPKGNWCEYKGGEGHEVPSPFSNTNQVVELADGEAYTLIGRVVFMSNVPYLHVNLSVHPWLATSRRKAFPFYRLTGSPTFYKDFELKEVRILGQAQLELTPAGSSLKKYSSAASADAALGYALAFTPSPTFPIQVLSGDSDSDLDRYSP